MELGSGQMIEGEFLSASEKMWKIDLNDIFMAGCKRFLNTGLGCMMHETEKVNIKAANPSEIIFHAYNLL